MKREDGGGLSGEGENWGVVEAWSKAEEHPQGK